MANINISQILMKRGNIVAASNYVGPLGELLVDTGLKTIRIQDGVTRGGWLVASNAQVWALSNSISTITGIDATFLANINTLLSNAATQQISLNTINANLGAFGTYANATFGTSSYGNANVALYLQDHPQGGTTYSNSNVASYLISNPQSGTYSNSNVESFIGGNVGSYQIYANANAATQATGINSINANIGAFQTYANNTFSTGTYSNSNVESYIGANIGSLWSNAATQATSLNTITANLGAYQTYANANAATQAGSITTLQTQVYANANVASYLPTYTGNIAGNIVKNGYAWTFGTDGALTLPADAGQIGISGYTNGIDLYNNSGGTGYVRMNYADESFVWTDSGGSHIQTTGGTWDFGTDANLTLPSTGYLRVGTGIVAGFASSPAPIISGFSSVSAENFTFLGNGVNILSSVAGTYGNANVASYLTGNTISTINTTGNIKTIANVISPNYLFANGVNILSTVTGSYGNTQANALLSSNTVSTISTTGNIKTIANVIGTTFRFANGVNILSTVSAGLAAPSQSNTSTNYNIVMNNSGTLVYGSGNGGTAATLNPYTGYIGVSGMTIGGYGVTASTGFDYVVNLNSRALTFTQTGNLSVPGNVVATSAYYGTQYNFANGVNILSTITPSSSYSNTNVASYLTTATITTTGNVTAGKFIGDGSGLTGVALKTTGSWTVTTGTNTYSFTVPASGTYQLWVDCNIPNGILVWNATATITNTNVPVVGAQYAWVYNGGGSPIDFTSIPNQFTGTGNTIVRSSVAPSATTNRFDFGLNNTSGGNVTVRYGWIQIG